MTLRQRLEQVEKTSPGLAQPIEEPDPPADCMHLWAWFWELDAARTEGMNGWAPITYQDIAAWSGLTQTTLDPWEVRALRAMDAARLDETAKVTK